MTAKGFHDKMLRYLNAYQEHILLSKTTTYLSHTLFHCHIIQEFINYLYNYHLISGVDQITVSMANSKFWSHFKKKNDEIIPKEQMKAVLKDYFVFLSEKYEIENEKLMKGFENKNPHII